MAPISSEAEVTARESRGDGFIIDACGNRVNDDGTIQHAGRSVAATSRPTISVTALAASAPVTIDLITTNVNQNHTANAAVTVIGPAHLYHLSDGSQWLSGYGFNVWYQARLDHVEVSGTTVRYTLIPPVSTRIYQQIDYNSGSHSAQGTLAAAGPLVLEAEIGSTTAVLHGLARIAENDVTPEAEELFNYYTAPTQSVVPFETVITISGDTWTTDTFSRAFNYHVAAAVDFANPVSVPPAIELSIGGPARIPDESTANFTASVRYEGGAVRDATAAASWAVDHPEVASIAGGLLTTSTLATAEVLLTVQASFTDGGPLLEAEKPVRLLADDPAERPGSWPMFQANARHTGHIGGALDPRSFLLKWQRYLGGVYGYGLNPVAAGEGKVFVSLRAYYADATSVFALDAGNGATLWSTGFGDDHSVGSPSFAYGNVYVQTSDYDSGNWLRAFDSETGEVLFQEPHGASENFFSPTLYDGKIYLSGGIGVLAVDAYSGSELWSAAVPQFDQWTPAVDADRVWEYLGEYPAGLHAQTRSTGGVDLYVADPDFDWNGYDMNLAPVLGGLDDMLVTQAGRLISFDTAIGSIRWQIQGQYLGQPSVAAGRIYAIDGGRLRVLDELTHQELWSWAAPEGYLAGPMIVTDAYVFASTSQKVHALDLVTHLPVWSYAAAGHLAIADDTLYVASEDGLLTALAPPPATGYYTLPPCRVVDTRGAEGVPIGGPALSAGAPRALPFAGHCGVPPTAAAVAINVTIIGPEAPGSLNLGPAGGAGPLLPLVDYSAGQTRANNSVLSLGADGQLTAVAMQPAGTTAHLVIEVSGYFE